MHRWISILMALVMGAGPLAAALPAGDGVRLPACCRKNGAHHCAMALMMGKMESPVPAFSAPAVCPAYPGSVPAVVTANHALAVTQAPMPQLSPAAAESPSSFETIPSAPSRSHAGRGPPQSILL